MVFHRFSRGFSRFFRRVGGGKNERGGGNDEEAAKGMDIQEGEFLRGVLAGLAL